MKRKNLPRGLGPKRWLCRLGLRVLTCLVDSKRTPKQWKEKELVDKSRKRFKQKKTHQCRCCSSSSPSVVVIIHRRRPSSSSIVVCIHCRHHHCCPLPSPSVVVMSWLLIVDNVCCCHVMRSMWCDNNFFFKNCKIIYYIYHPRY